MGLQPSLPLRLHDVRYRGGALEYADRHETSAAAEYGDYLEEARRLALEVPAQVSPGPPSRCEDEAFERLRWFPLPHEVS